MMRTSRWACECLSYVYCGLLALRVPLILVPILAILAMARLCRCVGVCRCVGESAVCVCADGGCGHSGRR